jgi:aminoglycoside 3-N-acetyltransferase I
VEKASPSVDLRRLTGPDEGLARKMLAMFGAAFDEPDVHRHDGPSGGHLRSMLAQDHVIALAACVGDEVIGGLVAYELVKLEGRREVYLYDLAVAEAHRRRGVATALIERLRAIAAERGAWVVYVQADYGDDPAVALYTKLGAREDVMHFDISVPPRRR